MAPFQGVKPASLDPQYVKTQLREILLDQIIQLYLTPQSRVGPTNEHLKNIIGDHANCDPVADVMARLESEGVDLSDLLRTSNG